eukprot:c24182_g2_i1 orf=359-1558(+)
MVGCSSCRWFTASHVAGGWSANCHADDLILLNDQCGRGRPLIFGGTGTLGLKVSPVRQFGSQCCRPRQRLESWKLQKSEKCLVISRSSPCEVVCISVLRSLGKWFEDSQANEKAERSLVDFRISSSFISTATAVSRGGKAKYLQCTQKAGGDKMAMETSHSCSAEHVETEIPLSLDAANPNSIPGIIYPSASTVGKSTNIVWQECMAKKEDRHKLLGQKGCVIWITGLSGSGKSTLACTLDHALINRGKLSYVLDGDNIRHGLNKNLGFTAEDRTENIRRVGEVARLFADAGIICIASLISPYRKDRDACRKLMRPEEFIEVFMNFPLSLCEQRDPKGLYKLARVGKIKGFTGVDDPYEAPLNCEIVMEPIDGRCPTPAAMAAQLLALLEKKGFLEPPF